MNILCVSDLSPAQGGSFKNSAGDYKYFLKKI